MLFRLLGQVDVWAGERSHSVGPLKSQAVLAALLIESGRVVSVQTLAERVWDEQMPVRARETLQVYVSRLRKRLQAAGDEPAVITSSAAGGYRLDVDADHVDVRRFNQLVSHARTASTSRDPHRARELLRQAEALWRGEPLEGLTGQWVETVRRGLLERRRLALFSRISLDLQIEANREDAISELAEFTHTGRIDQGAIELLMTTMAETGREAEALEVFHAARLRLREELGVDPRRELASLHQAILRGEPVSERPSARGVRRGALAPNTLDRDPPYLIGRDEVLREIRAVVAEELATPASIALVAIDGMPGIGKTSLALRAAHQLAPQCPDGALQLDFRTHDPRPAPLDLRTAVVLLLGALGTTTRELVRAERAEELVALWRRRTSGLRLLIFFDDVDDVGQFADLLPVTPGSVILVTSRRRLAHLPSARQLTVASLTGLAAVRLLVRVTGRRFPQQSQQLRRFAAHCGGLPLAVAVAAAHLRAHPTWSLTDLVERLESQASTHLPDQLSVPVYRAFELSYRMLAPAYRKVLRLMASQPTPDIGVYAVAALVEEEPGAVDLLLETLVEHHLLEEVSRHRYRLHHLMRAFAVGRAALEDDEAELSVAVDRMICFYLATAARAERAVRPHRRIAAAIPDGPLAAQPRFEQAAAADAWLETEVANLLIVAAHTDATPTGRHVGVMACVIALYLDRRGLWPQAIELLTRAVSAVTAGQGDPADPAFAQLHHCLGSAYVRAQRLEEAATCVEIALDSWRVQQDRRGEADTLHELGRIQWRADLFESAGASFEASEALHRAVGNTRGRVYADYHRAIVLFEQNRHTEAFAVAHRALELLEHLQDASLACDVLINLAEMYRRIGRDEPARRYLDEAEHHARQHRSPQHLAAIALNGGILSHRAGDDAAAAASLRTALKLYETLGDRANRIDALTALAAVHGADDLSAAQACVGSAQSLLAEMQDAQRAARLEIVVAQLLIRAGRDVDSCEHLRMAIEYAQQADAPLEEIQARTALGTTLMALGDESGARREQRRVRSLQHRLGGGGSGKSGKAAESGAGQTSGGVARSSSTKAVRSGASERR